MTGDRARSRRAAALWAQGQFAGLCLAQAGAAALVLTASLGTGRTGHLSTQTSWVAVGVAGIAVAAVSAAVWVLSGNRRLVRRRIRLSAAVGHTFRPRIVPGIETDEPVAGPTMSHYHRRDCQLVRGKDARPATAAAHQRAQRTACAVCRP